MEFKLQEEVAGISKAEFDDFYDLWLGGKEQIQASGFVIKSGGTRVPVNKTFYKNHFVLSALQQADYRKASIAIHAKQKTS
ncbi:hypothetical protein [Paenibacillus sp. NPDC057934]|uniref:hypothetical protein n=1 Tax=Paenibacillus sp. NPDC057934 TaxID=3346282 RepID=UPI0036DD61F7